MEALLNRVRHSWRRHQPVGTSRLNASVLDRADDLSSGGLESWVESLRSHRREAVALKETASSPVDRIVCSALERALSEQLYRAEVLRPYERQAMAYLRLLALGLLPFDLLGRDREKRHDKDHQQLLIGRLHDGLNWLAYARVRLDEGLLPTTPELIPGATRLQQAILELVEPWAEAAELGVQAQIREAAERLISALDELKAIVARPRTVQTQGAKQPSPDPETLLRDVFGLNQPLGWLTEQFCARAEASVRALKALAEAGDASNSTPVSLSREGLTQRLLSAYYELRLTMIPLIGDPAAPAEIEPSSSLAAFLAPDALYVGKLMGLGDARLLVDLGPPHSSEICLSVRSWAYLCVLLAHELCPGHHEHVVHGDALGFGWAMDVLESSVGLEGWGTYAETLLLSAAEALSANLQVPYSDLVITAHLQRLRRLLSGLLWCVRHTQGQAAARRMLDDFMRRIPQPEAARLQRWGWPALHYGVGLVWTEEALSQLGRTLTDRSACHALYLSVGPLPPDLAVELSLHLRASGVGSAPPARQISERRS